MSESLFVNKVADLTPATLLKKGLWRCFPVNFAKIFRAPFLQNTSGRLLLLLIQKLISFELFQRNLWVNIYQHYPKTSPIQCQCCLHIETSQLICCANQLTGFYMRATTLTFNGFVKGTLMQI